jgi:hypothetical protein
MQNEVGEAPRAADRLPAFNAVRSLCGSGGAGAGVRHTPVRAAQAPPAASAAAGTQHG